MNYAYVTMLSTNDYLDGVLALYQGLKETKAKYPLVVCVTNNITKDNIIFLNRLNIQTIPIPSFKYTSQLELAQQYNYRFKHTAHKIAVFNLTTFDKLVFLDCDMLILQNIDILFSYPNGSAVQVGGVGGPNAGVMVLEPNYQDYLFLIKQLKLGYSDEGSFKQLFSRWVFRKDLHLPRDFNIDVRYYKGGLSPKIIHFQGKDKPFLPHGQSSSFYFNIYAKIYLQYIEKAKLDARF